MQVDQGPGLNSSIGSGPIMTICIHVLLGPLESGTGLNSVIETPPGGFPRAFQLKLDLINRGCPLYFIVFLLVRFDEKIVSADDR